MIKGFKDLEVYQKAYNNSLEMHKISLTFPKFEQTELGSQIRRATKSVALNIAEGFGKNSSIEEFKRFLRMSRGSCDEVRAQLDYCKDLGYITEQNYSYYEQEYIEIGKMLTGLINSLQ